MNGLTNHDLENFCKKILGNSFLGVYPSDAQPLTFKKRDNVSVIFNLSPHNETGSHFVAVFKKNKKIFYFDSFGKILKNKHLLKFLKPLTLTLYCNMKSIQSKKSNFCGLFCLAFLIVCQKNKKTISQFQKMFTENLKKKNDAKVLNIILSNC